MIQDSLWKILGIILCVILLFVVPIASVYERQDAIAYNILLNETNEFSQKIREIGYIDQVLIDNLNTSLSGLGVSFEIVFEHQSKRFGTDQGIHRVYYEGVYTEDITTAILNEGKYSFNMGDFFFVRIRNTSISPYGSFRKLLGIGGDTYLYAVSGGVVRYGDS